MNNPPLLIRRICSVLHHSLIPCLALSPITGHTHELPPHPYPQTVSQVRQRLAVDPPMAKQLETLLLKAVKTGASAPSGSSKDDFYSRISRELAVLGNTSSAISTATLISDRSRRRFAISSIAEIMVQTNDLAAARKLAQSKKGTRGWDSALFSVVREEIEYGYLEEARNSMASIQDPEDRVLLLIWLASGFVKAGDRNVARSHLEEALALTPRLPLDWGDAHRMPKDSALSKIAGVQAESKDWESAFQTTSLIQQDNYRAWALMEIAARQVTAGDLATALATADRLKEPDYRSGAKFRIAKQLESLGQYREAIDVLRSPLDDEQTSHQALISTALLQVKLEEFTAALKTVEFLETRPLSQAAESGSPLSGRTQVLDQIIQTQARSGDFAGAESVVAELPIERQWLALERIGKIQGGKEGIQKIEAAFEQARPEAKDCVLKLLSLSYEKVGDHEEAVRSANRARTSIGAFSVKGFQESFPGATPQLVNLNKRHHYRELSEVQARIHDLDGALTTLSLIDDTPERAGALSSIAFVLGYQKKPIAQLNKIIASRSSLERSDALLGYVMGRVDALDLKSEPLSPFGTQHCHRHYQ